MAAQGRNNDSMLVHMTPKEVGGLHALAAANGGQLTVNPETGLPEAGFLEDILPAVIGFGLDTFVPGLGEAVGGAFGLSSAAGTGIAVAGLTGLATGSLSKGVMAGFGAYGGAGLSGSLAGAGVNAATTAGTAGYESILADRGFIPGTPEYGAAASEMALNAQKSAMAASPMDKLTKGFSASTQSPGALLDFAKGNGRYMLAAAAPALAGGFSGESQTATPMPDNRMITPFVMNRKNLPYDESISPSGQRSYLSHGVTALTPVRAADGGAVQHFDAGGDVREDEYGRTIGDPNFGKPSDRYEGPMIQGGFDQYGNLNGSGESRRAMLNRPPPADNTDEYTRLLLNAAKPASYRNTMTGESAKAFDYLMGNKASLPGTPVAPKPPRMPGMAPALSTDGVSALMPEFSSIGKGSTGLSQEQRDEKNDPNAWGNLTDQQQSAYFVDHPDMAKFVQGGQKLWGSTLLGKVQNYLDPSIQAKYQAIQDRADEARQLKNALEAGAGPIANEFQRPAYETGRGDTPALGVTFKTGPQDFSTQYGTESPGPEESAYRTLNKQLAEAAATPVTTTPAAVTNLPSSDNYSNEERNRGAASYSGNDGGDGGSSFGGVGAHAYSHGGLPDSRYADGGVTGGGNIDLHVPINIGGGSQGGGGFGGGNGIQQGGMPQPPMGGLAGLLGGLDPKAVAANPQGFSNFLQGAMRQEQSRPGSTMFSNPSGVMPQGGYSAEQTQPFGGINAQAPQQQQAMQGLGKQNQAFGGNMGGMRYGAFAKGGMTGMADGGLGSLGGYSDGGRLLRGPGDGVSDSIPATIGNRQPARLADGEFVVPARIVSELGNGSTEAGARQLYAMMDRIQAGRKKTVGKGKVAKNTRSTKHLPA